MAASIIALLLAQVVSLVLIARERERFILQGSVREWSRRVAEITTLLQGMDDTERAAMITRLNERPWRFGRRPPDAVMFRDGLVSTPEGGPPGGPPGMDDPMPPGHMGLHDDGGALHRPSGGPPGASDDSHAASPIGAVNGAGGARGPRPPGEAPGAPGDGHAPRLPDGTGQSSDRSPQAQPAAKVDGAGVARLPEGSATASLDGSHEARRAGEADGAGGARLPEGAAAGPLDGSHQARRVGGVDGAGVAQPEGPPGSADGRQGDGQSGDDLRGARGGHRPPMPMGPPHEDGRSLILRATTYPTVVPFTKAGDFEPAFEDQLHKDLGAGFEVSVTETGDPTQRAIPIGGPLFSEVHDSSAQFFDAKIKLPDGYTTVFRVTRYARGAPLPRGLFMNLALLVIVMSIALFVVARSITRPLSELARAADSVGRNLRQPKLAERGAREIRNAARAFNTMQDRMQRYLDSRSRVLAAMSHDLKTPLTRLRLQVEMLDDSAAQVKLGRQLDEMESMVHGALALFKGLDDNEAFTPVDVNEMVATLQSEFAELSAQVTLQGHATRAILGKPQALRRCLTNLIANAVKFGSQATVVIEDGAALTIRVRDDGPGIPAEELERVFEPFYRLESSRNRDTGGSGLGLSIARDVIQAHGGSLTLQNLPVRGLEAIVTLPRA